MAHNTSSAAFSGDRNQGFQLAYNSGHVDVSYHIAHSGMSLSCFCRVPPSEKMLMLVCRERKNPSLAPVLRYPSGETTTLSIAIHLLRSTHDVLSRLLEWHLLDWEASGNYEPTREVEMYTEKMKKITAGDRVLLPSPRQLIGNMGVLGPCEQQSEN